jgi:hypothetical protein
LAVAETWVVAPAEVNEVQVTVDEAEEVVGVEVEEVGVAVGGVEEDD